MHYVHLSKPKPNANQQNVILLLHRFGIFFLKIKKKTLKVCLTLHHVDGGVRQTFNALTGTARMTVLANARDVQWAGKHL